MLLPETYLEPSQTSKMKFFAKIVDGFQLPTILQINSSYMFEKVLNTPNGYYYGLNYSQ